MDATHITQQTHSGTVGIKSSLGVLTAVRELLAIHEGFVSEPRVVAHAPATTEIEADAAFIAAVEYVPLDGIGLATFGADQGRVGVGCAALLATERTITAGILPAVFTDCGDGVWDRGHALLVKYLANSFPRDSDPPSHLGLRNSWVSCPKLFDYLGRCHGLMRRIVQEKRGS